MCVRACKRASVCVFVPSTLQPLVSISLKEQKQPLTQPYDARNDVGPNSSGHPSPEHYLSTPLDEFSERVWKRQWVMDGRRSTDVL